MPPNPKIIVSPSSSTNWYCVVLPPILMVPEHIKYLGSTHAVVRIVSGMPPFSGISIVVGKVLIAVGASLISKTFIVMACSMIVSLSATATVRL